MANIKSAKKRILVSEKKAARNKAVKSSVKTAVKHVRTAIEANDKAAAEAALKSCASTIDKAESKGVLKKNTASRKVARLSSAVNNMQ
ncbi:MAG: 30S ribosomal protein S20 [Lachnospiraceae bacterium]|nr:30S ribosomal protein S20 [Lachnospiraceae bacterium]